MSDNTFDAQTADQEMIHEARFFSSREAAIAFVQTVADPFTIIIITPPPH